MAKRWSNFVRASSAYILPPRCKRGSFPPHPPQAVPLPLEGKAKDVPPHPSRHSRDTFPSRGRQKPFSSPEAKDLLTLFGDLREEPLEREAVSAPLRSALDTCHRHTAPPFLRKVPGFFRLERSESSFCQRVGAQSSWPRFLRKKAEKRFWKGDGLIYE